MRKGMEWARGLDLDVLFIKIDFEKAYDVVEWLFILVMLKVVSFWPFFVSTVQIVFSETFACLSVDKCKSDEVGLFQSKDAPWLPL